MSIKSELLAIQKRTKDRILYPRDVVKWAASNPESDLHRSIEWDDERAADAHRLWQVRQLIQLHIVSEDRTPQMISLSFDRQQEGGYRSISDVVSRPDLREIMLVDALAELERVQEKYARVQVLREVWAEADNVRKVAGVKRKRPARELVEA